MRLAAALVAAVIGSAIVAAAGGTATGTFTVQGKATPMAYAYASAKADASDKSKEEIHVIVSDVALDDKVLTDPTPFGLQDLTKANKLHGIKFIINPEKQVISTSMYDAAFKMGSVSVAGSDIKLEVQTLTKTNIAGKLYTAKAGDFNGVPYQYNFTFSAPITR